MGVRIQRVRKNLKTAFQTVATNESNLRKLFAKLDMDSDASLSLYEFKTFVRMNLKLSFWDVNNTDIDEFYHYLDKDGQGISVDELMSFVKSMPETCAAKRRKRSSRHSWKTAFVAHPCQTFPDCPTLPLLWAWAEMFSVVECDCAAFDEAVTDWIRPRNFFLILVVPAAALEAAVAALRATIWPLSGPSRPICR